MVVIVPVDNAEGILQHLGHGARQFVVQEALEITWCFAGS